MNFSPNIKILVSPKITIFPDNKFKVAQKFRLVFDEVENIDGKGENVGSEYFLFFQQCFQKASSSDPLIPGVVW